MRWINSLLAIAFVVLVSNAWGQNCDLAVTSVNFGSYDTIVSSPLNARGDINVTCDNGIAFIIKLNPGQNSGGGFHPRRMLAPGGSNTLNYNFFKDSAFTQVWGDGTGNTFVQSGLGTGGVQNFTVFGRIPAGQNVSVGSYSDTVTVTVEW